MQSTGCVFVTCPLHSVNLQPPSPVNTVNSSSANQVTPRLKSSNSVKLMWPLVVEGSNNYS